ncbi:mCG10377, isoform CRA_a, partial [Mus musculus]
SLLSQDLCISCTSACVASLDLKGPWGSLHLCLEALLAHRRRFCLPLEMQTGRLSERLARLQQEQLQQVPRGLCVQGLEPPSLSIPADPRVPVRTDHCDRKDEHTSAVPAPAMG